MIICSGYPIKPLDLEDPVAYFEIEFGIYLMCAGETEVIISGTYILII